MLEILNYIFLFFIGSVFASFLNLCVYRIEQESSFRDILLGKSFCEECNKRLGWLELIPLLSFLFLRGKCSECDCRINIFHFLTEVILGLCFVFLYFYSFDIYYYIFLLILYFWASSDFLYQTIPKNITDVVLFLSFLFWLIILFLDFDLYRVYSVVFSLIIALFVFLISLKKKAFGLGDIIVFFVLAFWFPLDFFLTTLLYSILIGGLVGIFLVLKDKTFFKKYVPFLPFVFLGFLLNLYFQGEGINPFDYIFGVW